ncbi:MAG: hypothetical protein ACREJ6_07370 [Candidatus Methylomirabilis sp.]
MAYKELTEGHHLDLAITEATRFLFKLVGGLISIAFLWIIFSRFMVPAVIESAYRGESFSFLNSIISGQAIHPVEHYLAAWEEISWRIFGVIVVVGLLPLPLVATGPEVQSYLERRYGNAWTLMPGVLTTTLSLVGLMSIFYLFYFYPVGYVYLIAEDHWGEYGQFVSWAMASCFLTWMLIKDRGFRKPGFVLLALGTFFVAMEEISWGQRIVGFASPAFFAESTLQGEITLHNLGPGIAWRLTWVAIIAIFLCGILPLFIRKWGWLRKWCDKLGIPSVRIHIWPLFLLAIFYHVSCPLLFRCDELRELFLSIAIVILSLDLVLTMRRGTRVRPAPTIVATVSMMLTVAILTAFLAQLYNWPSALTGNLNLFAKTLYPNAGMYPQAEMLFEYMNQHPQFLKMETHAEHGALLMRMGEHGKAKEILEIALAEQKRFQNETPDDPEPYRNAGKVLTLLGRAEEAQEEFQGALEKDRARLERATGARVRARVRWSLGITLLASGDAEAASAQLAMARAIAPDRRTQYLIDEWIQRNLKKDALAKPRGSPD